MAELMPSPHKEGKQRLGERITATISSLPTQEMKTGILPWACRPSPLPRPPLQITPQRSGLLSAPPTAKCTVSQQPGPQASPCLDIPPAPCHVCVAGSVLSLSS